MVAWNTRHPLDNYSYVPQSSGAHKIISSVSDYVESYQKTMDKLGDITLDNTGSPLAATLVQTSPELVTTLMGGRVALKSVKNSVVTNDSVTTSIREQVLAKAKWLENRRISTLLKLDYLQESGHRSLVV
ncbi:hypothetical protein EXA20_16200 [Vibrio cincinnatiensis]|uniref:hypothetical protein n=1 Tax=Vibrio cincinnatiensis TaxID=675 RepID=UPI001EDD595A|nr:hypothetical protein [Vibrio cincinnatiensis]MCG3737857.1 hypothetical protein [Vibrio cincinnatiensis]MCG3748527.1 hypothetical protein [Vibrio cincinnatiensis]